MKTTKSITELPTHPRERCIALLRQSLLRETVRTKIRLTLEDGMAREIEFGKLNGKLFGDGRLSVKPPRNISWRVRNRIIGLSLSEIIDEDDAELFQLLQKHLTIPSFPALESGHDYHTDQVAP